MQRTTFQLGPIQGHRRLGAEERGVICFPIVLAYKAALAASGLLMRAAVGLVGIMVVVGAIAPRPEPDARARSEPGDPGTSWDYRCVDSA